MAVSLIFSSFGQVATLFGIAWLFSKRLGEPSSAQLRLIERKCKKGQVASALFLISEKFKPALRQRGSMAGTVSRYAGKTWRCWRNSGKASTVSRDRNGGFQKRPG